MSWHLQSHTYIYLDFIWILGADVCVRVFDHNVKPMSDAEGKAYLIVSNTLSEYYLSSKFIRLQELNKLKLLFQIVFAPLYPYTG